MRRALKLAKEVDVGIVDIHFSIIRLPCHRSRDRETGVGQEQEGSFCKNS